MLANDVRKGARIQLRNGWYGTMMDNMKGNTRMVDVEGDFREIGSVYTHDILVVQRGDGSWESVTLSDRQKKVATQIHSMGF